jgi:hypothetical protein
MRIVHLPGATNHTQSHLRQITINGQLWCLVWLFSLSFRRHPYAYFPTLTLSNRAFLFNALQPIVERNDMQIPEHC